MKLTGERLEEEALAEEMTIPVIEERIVVGRREVVTDRILLQKTIHAREDVVEIPLISRSFEVLRFPSEKVVDAAPPVRVDGDTTIYSIIEERLVKQIVVIEEIHVTLRQKQVVESRVVTLKREEVSVEHVEASSEK